MFVSIFTSCLHGPRGGSCMTTDLHNEFSMIDIKRGGAQFIHVHTQTHTHTHGVNLCLTHYIVNARACSHVMVRWQLPWCSITKHWHPGHWVNQCFNGFLQFYHGCAIPVVSYHIGNHRFLLSSQVVCHYCLYKPPLRWVSFNPNKVRVT